MKITILSLLFPLFFLLERDIKVYDNFKEFEPVLNLKNDTTYIINFWATWCIPCRKEMPDFEKFSRDNKDKKIKLLFVSLDMAEEVDKKLIPFLEKFNINSEVVVLDDPNSNYWISRVDETWSGTIPATLIYKNKNRSFHASPLTYENLDSIVKNLK